MRGHEAVIEMRQQGRVPQAIRLHVGGDLSAYYWRDWPTYTTTAQVHIPDDDSLGRLDLRFVVGLLVWVDGADADRVEAVEAAVKGAGASRVLTAVYGPIAGLPGDPENLEIKAMRDTREKGFTWQQ